MIVLALIGAVSIVMFAYLGVCLWHYDPDAGQALPARRTKW
jgi:hypothetical protein